MRMKTRMRMMVLMMMTVMMKTMMTMVMVMTTMSVLLMTPTMVVKKTRRTRSWKLPEANRSQLLCLSKSEMAWCQPS